MVKSPPVFRRAKADLSKAEKIMNLGLNSVTILTFSFIVVVDYQIVRFVDSQEMSVLLDYFDR